ncbi:MAG: hypothetical protein QXW44_08140 [Pyrobaculum sp.]
MLSTYVFALGADGKSYIALAVVQVPLNLKTKPFITSGLVKSQLQTQSTTPDNVSTTHLPGLVETGRALFQAKQAM